jgi:alpha-N-arabinofuranosidase
MTSFTKIPDDQQPVISINPAFKLSKIEDNTYGGFTEYAADPRTPEQRTGR